MLDHSPITEKNYFLPVLFAVFCILLFNNMKCVCMPWLFRLVRKTSVQDSPMNQHQTTCVIEWYNLCDYFHSLEKQIQDVSWPGIKGGHVISWPLKEVKLKSINWKPHWKIAKLKLKSLLSMQFHIGMPQYNLHLDNIISTCFQYNKHLLTRWVVLLLGLQS